MSKLGTPLRGWELDAIEAKRKKRARADFLVTLLFLAVVAGGLLWYSNSEACGDIVVIETVTVEGLTL